MFRIIPALSPRPLTFVCLFGVFLGCGAQGKVGHDRPKAEYSAESGRLQRLTFDSNDDGRNDAVGIMEGTRLARIEVDTTGNGKPDRWDFYDDGRLLRRVGLSRMDDGVMDAVAVYGADDQMLRLEVSTRRDGRFDRIEFYESSRLARVEEDTDGDGRVDKWETYRRNPESGPGAPPVVVSTVAFDDAATGRPTRRLVYGADGSMARVEQARPDGTFGSDDREPGNFRHESLRPSSDYTGARDARGEAP